MLRIRRAVMPLIALAILSPASALAAHDLFISEYVEGSSFNKAIEIYNPTGAPVNLSTYSIQIYFNGSATAGNTIALPAVSLAAGDVFVVANSSAAAPVLAAADLASASLNHNGDDVVALVNGAANIDVIGQIGFDPGSAWGSEPNTTANHTLRRNVCEGDTNGSDPFDPATEWTSFASDTFDDLGAHSGCAPAAPGAPGWALAGLAGLLLAGATFALRRRAAQPAA